jgi:hypothetical protein
VAARDFQALSRLRAGRARLLEERYEASREALRFLAGVFDWQTGPAPQANALFDLAIAEGPEPLANAARGLDDARLRAAAEAYLSGADRDSPEAFFARCLLQVEIAARDTPEAAPESALCPRCGEGPQGGCLRPLAHGAALTLFCSLCLAEWPYPRGRCPACGEHGRLLFHTAEQLPHVTTMTCDGCQSYLHLIDLSKDAAAVPDVDEIAAMPLDLWAIERGYAKPRLNLAGV